MGLKINIWHKDDIAVIELAGEVNINSYDLIEAIGKLLKSRTKNIIISFEQISSVDYNGLSVMAIAYKSVLNNKGTLKLSSVPEDVMELLHMVKLDNVFSIYETTEKAIDSFSKLITQKHKDSLLVKPLRRRFQRLGMDITVYYKKTQTSKENKHPIHSGLIGNISGAGMFLRGINIFPIGTKVDLDLVLEEPNKCITMKGMVVWVADQQIQPDFYPGMGIQFLNIAPQTQSDLITFIEKNTAE